MKPKAMALSKAIRAARPGGERGGGGLAADPDAEDAGGKGDHRKFGEVSHPVAEDGNEDGPAQDAEGKAGREAEGAAEGAPGKQVSGFRQHRGQASCFLAGAARAG